METQGPLEVEPEPEMRPWRDAPGVVRAVRLIAMFALAMALLVVVLAVLTGASSDQSPAPMLVGGVLAMVVSGLYIQGLKQGARWLWFTHLALSILAVGFYSFGLLATLVAGQAFPGASDAYRNGHIGGGVFGLVLTGAILYCWVQPDTKRWFVR